MPDSQYTVCGAVLLLGLSAYGFRSIWVGPDPAPDERATRAVHSVLLFYTGLVGLVLLAFRGC